MKKILIKNPIVNVVIYYNVKIEEIHLYNSAPDDEYQCEESGIAGEIKRQFGAYFGEKEHAFDISLLNLDKVSDFQRKVYNELLKVGFGRTVSYEELAMKVATKDHRRAVARTMAANPFPIIIPCHRVVPKRFDRLHLGGFGAGVDIKERLLSFENESLFSNS